MMKLKYKLFLFFIIVISVSSLTTLILVRSSTETMFRSFVFTGDSSKAKVYASLLSDYYQKEESWTDVQQFLKQRTGLSHPSIDAALLAEHIVLADTEGIIIADTADVLLGTVHPSMHLVSGIPIMSGRERIGTVLVGSMIDSSLTGIAERFLLSITRSLFFASLLSVALSLFLGFFFATRITKPLAALASAAKSVAGGKVETLVLSRGHDEISELSLSFNEMTAELKRLDAARKQVIADSAHELRTPVTLIQGTIEGMIDGIFPLDITTLSSVHEETIRLARLIETLRELEIIESGELLLSLEKIDIRDMIRKALPLFATSARQKNISLSFEENSSQEKCVFTICADSLRLNEVIYNLLSNALNYTPSGGRVRVRVEANDERTIQFSIDDSGPGIEIEERSLIFERFYRTDKSRSSVSGGRGLGLAIAAEIVKAHQGSISVATSDLGGASFLVILPRLLLSDVKG